MSKRGCGAFPYTVGFYSVFKNDVMAFVRKSETRATSLMFHKNHFKKGNLNKKKNWWPELLDENINKMFQDTDIKKDVSNQENDLKH